MILADPIATGRLPSDAIKSIERGILPSQTEVEGFYSGDCGNGIVCYRKTPGKTWFGTSIFWDEAEFCSPPGMELLRCDDVAKVSFIHLRGDAGLRLWGEGRTKPREYRCHASIEHVESANDEVYWLLEVSGGKTPYENNSLVEMIGKGFGMEICHVATDKMHANVVEEVRRWFPMDRNMVWFKVTGAEMKAGLQLAMSLYCVLHVKSVPKSRIQAMYLVADIEGKPRIRSKL